MPRVFLPYAVGGDSPIPYLFESIVPHFDPSDFAFTVYATPESRPVAGHCRRIVVPDQGTLRRRMAYVRGALGRYDLVHTGGRPHLHYPTARVAHLRNRNLRHVHTFRVDVDLSWDYADEREVLFDYADAFTAVSEHTAETARQKLGVDPTVVYNGVDTDLFHPDYDRSPLLDGLVDPGDPLFLFVGSLVERKRPLDVAAVARSVPEATFVFVGSGPQSEDLAEAIEGLDNAHALGHVEKDKLPALYASATGLVFPSVREGCPNVVLEAMASAAPVVGYEATSMPELVTTGETGYLCAVDDVDGLATGVREAIEHEEQWGTAARSYVRDNHTFDRLAGQYRSIYREVLA